MNVFREAMSDREDSAINNIREFSVFCEGKLPPHAVEDFRIVCSLAAIAAAARQGGDVQQAPGEAPQSGGEAASPNPSEHSTRGRYRMSELKPCPFCGTKLREDGDAWHHEMADCPLSDCVFDEQQIAEWNTRAQVSA